MARRLWQVLGALVLISGGSSLVGAWIVVDVNQINETAFPTGWWIFNPNYNEAEQLGVMMSGIIMGSIGITVLLAIASSIYWEHWERKNAQGP